MRGITLASFGSGERALLREVALTYRRTRRELMAEGKPPWFYEQAAADAARALYLERTAGNEEAQRKAQTRVPEMIAAAINVDTHWFWHGPDA